MAIVHYTEASGGLPNSGRLSGTDGDLVGIMDVVLVAAGWAIEYTGTNTRVYRPGSGNRFRLHMNDASATSGNAGLCVVRGCENASNSTTLTDPFPTVALVGNGSANWIKSSAANTTARNFDIFASPTWVIYVVNFAGTANQWEWHFFGDCAPAFSGDSYATLCTSRNSTSVAATNMYSSNTAGLGTVGGTTLFWCRSYDGTVKCTRSMITHTGNNGTSGLLAVGYPQAFLGPSTGLDTEKTNLMDTGSTTTAISTSLGLPTRGYLPNILIPMHAGKQTSSPTSRDTYTNTAYNASFVGTVFTNATAAGSAFISVEGSDTWSAPSG